jgi:hypothetical protein
MKIHVGLKGHVNEYDENLIFHHGKRSRIRNAF